MRSIVSLSSLMQIGATMLLLTAGCSVQKEVHVSQDGTVVETVHSEAPTVSFSSEGESGGSFVYVNGKTYVAHGKGSSIVVNNDEVTINGKKVASESTTRTVHSNILAGNDNTRTVTQSLPLAGIRTVAVESDFGAITIERSSDPYRIGVTATVSLGNQNDSRTDMNRYLSGFTIPTEAKGSTYTARVQPPRNLPKNMGWTVSYRVTVPDSVALDLNTDNGAVTVNNTGTRGKVKAHSSFGAITITNAGTVLDTKTSNGKVTIYNRTPMETVNAKSEFGAISVTGTARVIDADTENGAVDIQGASHAKDVMARSEFGAIHLNDVGGDIDARTSNGSVTYSGTPSSLVLQSEFGSITADIHNAAFLTRSKLTTSNGSVTANLPRAASVKITGHTDNGSIRANGFSAQINGDNFDKSIQASLNGGRVPFDLSSEFGSLTVSAR